MMPFRRKLAFTLIEILTVLAIIALLAALLFGVTVRVREKARQTHCSSNLKQLYSALQQYLQDNDSRYPSHTSWEFAADPYLKSQDVFMCLSQITHKEHNEHVSDYAYNVPRFSRASNSTVTLPTYAIFLEDNWPEPDSSPPDLPFPESCGITLWGSKEVVKGYSTLHSEGSNYLFGDGHVKWLLPANAHDSECKAGPFQPSYQ